MIVAVENGAVAEVGTHDELMEKDGVYKKLVLLQVNQDGVCFALVKLNIKICIDSCYILSNLFIFVFIAILLILLTKTLTKDH